MKLEVECTWNEGKDKAKQQIYFNAKPKYIFSLPDETIFEIQRLEYALGKEGPVELEKLETLAKEHPKSLFTLISYYQALRFFELFDDAEPELQKMKKNFPSQAFTKCCMAESLLDAKKLDDFPATFDGMEFLQRAFPKRREFFFREALFFHNLWGRYHLEMGNEFKTGKHRNFIMLIMNTFNSSQIAAHSNAP